MNIPARCLKLESRLGYKFADRTLLLEALTHRSSRTDGKNSERLEFLGDRVLGLCMAERLITQPPEASVGKIAAQFNMLVSGRSCTEIARSIGLEHAVLVGSGFRGAPENISARVLAECMEAVIAAVYIDGGLDAARELVGRLWNRTLDVESMETNDYKSALQVLVQAEFRDIPTYEVLSRTGSAHNPEFLIRVASPCGACATAAASSKRRAEKLAAKKLLAQLSTSDA
ncbi:MAG: ribonuclease III [Rhodobacteraceae bacterium]|nr:ribonuclease III [Paracoccaceae bacterium]